MRPKNLVSGCLSAFLSASLLVACGGGTGPSSAASQSQGPHDVSAAPTVVQPPGEVAVLYTAGSSGPSTLSINGHVLSDETTAENLVQVVGAPSRTVADRGDEASYFYDDIGMVFFVSAGRLGGAGFNYHWDGDEHFPNTAFTGALTIGELAVSMGTTKEDIEAVEDPGFTCPSAIMCATKDHSARVKGMVAFKDGKLTQVVFLLSSD